MKLKQFVRVHYCCVRSVLSYCPHQKMRQNAFSFPKGPVHPAAETLKDDKMKKLKIWDPFVRIFHWSLVIGFAVNALVLKEDSNAHIWVGYAIVALVVARILWGFVGTRNARFSAFTPNRDQVIGQISDIATRRRTTHLGHSPLGALMIFNLIISILIIGISGYMMTTDAYWGVDWVSQIHETFVGWAEISVVLHIAAVIFESKRTNINLSQAMITGIKTIPKDVILEE